MLVFVLYLVALVSPVLVFGLVTSATLRKMLVALKENPRKLAPARTRRIEDVDSEMAVLEAQFLVAPRMAFDEAQALLTKTNRRAEIEATTLVDRRSFEHVLQALAT